jgi:hypothetical protein
MFWGIYIAEIYRLSKNKKEEESMNRRWSAEQILNIIQEFTPSRATKEKYIYAEILYSWVGWI